MRAELENARSRVLYVVFHGTNDKERVDAALPLKLWEGNVEVEWPYAPKPCPICSKIGHIARDCELRRTFLWRFAFVDAIAQAALPEWLLDAPINGDNKSLVHLGIMMEQRGPSRLMQAVFENDVDARMFVTHMMKTHEHALACLPVRVSWSDLAHQCALCGARGHHRDACALKDLSSVDAVKKYMKKATSGESIMSEDARDERALREQKADDMKKERSKEEIKERKAEAEAKRKVTVAAELAAREQEQWKLNGLCFNYMASGGRCRFGAACKYNHGWQARWSAASGGVGAGAGAGAGPRSKYRGKMRESSAENFYGKHAEAESKGEHHLDDDGEDEDKEAEDIARAVEESKRESELKAEAEAAAASAEAAAEQADGDVEQDAAGVAPTKPVSQGTQ